MFNTFFRKNFTESAPTPEPTYIEVSDLMGDFISLEEIAPGAEWSDVMAATWGIPSAPDTAEMRSVASSELPVAKAVRSFLQSFRSSLGTV